MRTTSRVLAPLVAGAAIAILASADPPPRKIRVAAMPYLSHALLWMAARDGLFAAQGLEVEIVQMERTDSLLPVIAQGGMDATTSAPGPAFFNAVARGARLRMVADRGHVAPGSCTYGALVARKALADSGALSSAAGWKGRRISMGPVVFSYVAEVALDKQGVKLSDLEETDVPQVVRPTALRTGALDLSFETEPWLTRIVAEGSGVVVRRMEDLTPGLQWGVVIFGPTLLDKDPEAGVRFMTAYLQAVRRFQEGKTPHNRALVAEVTGLAPALVEQTCWPTFDRDGRVRLDSLLEYQGWAVRKGQVDRPISAAEVWEPRFVEEAARRLDQVGK